jgi:hypothetical protein
MNEKNSLQNSPQLTHNEQHALALSPKQAHSLYKKSKTFEIPFEILEEVYRRGFEIAAQNKEKAGFNRVDSFIHGGEAAELDTDLQEGFKDLLKQAGKDVFKTAFPHIKKPSAPKVVKQAKKYAKKLKEATVGEPQSSNPDEPSSRFSGTTSLTNIYKAETPGQETTADVVKRVIKYVKTKKDAE